jgi:hypothetical protein
MRVGRKGEHVCLGRGAGANSNKEPSSSVFDSLLMRKTCEISLIRCGGRGTAVGIFYDKNY